MYTRDRRREECMNLCAVQQMVESSKVRSSNMAKPLLH